MPIYYPAVAVKLVVRFDEALLSGKNPTPKSSEQTATDTGKLGGAGEQGGGASKQAAMFDDGGELTKSLVIIPTSASIELPSYRQTPKFSMTFAWKDFPVDPRAIRSMAARIYIGVVSNTDFQSGMRNLKENLDANQGRLASQLTLKPENLMLVGLVDNLTTEHTDKGSNVTIDGRGISGALLDAKISSETMKKIDVDKPIDEVVEQILGFYPQGAGIPVIVDAAEWPDKKVAVLGDIDILSRDNKGQDGKKKSFNPVKADPNSMAYWDLITRLCDLVGALPYFIADQLWIRPVKSIYNQKNAGYAGTGDTPFMGPNGEGKPRTIEFANGQKVEASIRKMIYGRNLLTWKIERKFGGLPVPWVKTVSIDMSKPKTERIISGNWPPLSKQEEAASAVDPSGKESRGEALRVPVPGITDIARLDAIAENIYNEVGRGELGGSGSSKDLASLGGDNSDVDLLRLRPGDAMEFAIDASGLQAHPPIASTLADQAAASPGDVEKDLQDRLGIDKKLAEVLVGTARGKFKALQNVFRVANVKYTWALASGIAVDFDFQNYVVARYDFKNPSAVEGEGELGATSILTKTFGSSTGAA